MTAPETDPDASRTVAPHDGRRTSRRRRRRTLVSTLTAAALVLGGAGFASAHTSGHDDHGRHSGHNAPAHHPKAKPTIVLVHGAWADSGGFAAVAGSLARDGYTVLEPANPLRGLPSDAAYLAAYLQQHTTGPVVLVGHSYGGAVITEAGTSDPDVRALVYIDAFAPTTGESLNDLLTDHGANPIDASALFDVVANGDPSNPADVDLYLKQSVFPVAFANGLPASTQAQLYASQRPLAQVALLDPLAGVPAWRTLPSWYVEGTKDQIIPPALQASMAHRAGSHVIKVPTGHLAMIADPKAVTTVILKAVNATD